MTDKNPATMQVRAMGTVKHHPHYLEAGDVKTVPYEDGEIMVSHGWCENVETGEIGERKGGPVTLDTHNGKLATKAKE